MKYALVTVFFPTIDVCHNISKLLPQFDKVFVLDNTPLNDNSILFKDYNLEYIFFNENRGLSLAFNYVLTNSNYVFSDDDFIFFFDQDSSVEDNHVDLIIKEFESLENNGNKVGCLGPVFFNTSSNLLEVPRKKGFLNKNSFSVKSVITSSMCCRYSVLKDVGFWNDEIFLDMADWDLSWRIINKNYLCVMTNIVVMTHSLGIGERRILGFLRVRQGAPIREYYQTRDCLYLLKKNYVPLKFKLRFILMILVRPFVHYIFLIEKNKRMSYVFQGIIDYFKKKKGCIR